VATTKSGYEGILYYGAAGSTGSEQVTNCEDLNYDTEPERVETTVRGAGTSPPIVTSKVVALKPTITWSMLLKTGDTTLTALLAAARTGAAVALRTKSYSSGLGFDGDCTLGVTHEMTLKGQSKFNFTAEATDDEGRAPQLNV
jgi:hypothetical protein